MRGIGQGLGTHQMLHDFIARAAPKSMKIPRPLVFALDQHVAAPLALGQGATPITLTIPCRFTPLRWPALDWHQARARAAIDVTGVSHRRDEVRSLAFHHVRARAEFVA